MIDARTLYEFSLTRGSEGYSPSVQRHLGFIAVHAGNLAESLSLMGKSLRWYEGYGNTLGIVECLAAFVATAVARLLGAVETGLQDMGGTLYFGDRFEHAKTLAS